jgi:hypothetical protein
MTAKSYNITVFEHALTRLALDFTIGSPYSRMVLTQILAGTKGKQ